MVVAVLQSPAGRQLPKEISTGFRRSPGKYVSVRSPGGALEGHLAIDVRGVRNAAMARRLARAAAEGLLAYFREGQGARLEVQTRALQAERVSLQKHLARVGAEIAKLRGSNEDTGPSSAAVDQKLKTLIDVMTRTEVGASRLGIQMKAVREARQVVGAVKISQRPAFDVLPEKVLAALPVLPIKPFTATTKAEVSARLQHQQTRLKQKRAEERELLLHLRDRCTRLAAEARDLAGAAGAVEELRESRAAIMARIRKVDDRLLENRLLSRTGGGLPTLAGIYPAK